MALPNRFGDTSVRLVDQFRSYNSKSGFRTTLVYEGLKADIRGLFESLVQAGYTFSERPAQGQKGILEIQSDGPEDGRTQEELDRDLPVAWSVPPNNYTELDIYEFDGLGATPVIRAQNALTIKNLVTQTRAKPSIFDATYATLLTSGFALARTYALACKGQVSYQVPRFIIKRVVTLPAKYADEYQSSNISRQFTLAQLKSIEGLPDRIKVRVPQTGAWLKQATGTNPLPNGKEQVLDEWWHAPFWDDLHHPAAVAINPPLP